GLSGYPERPANIAHRLPVQDSGDKPQALVHDRTLLPRHQHPPPNGEKCYPCVRYKLSPMSQAAHPLASYALRSRAKTGCDLRQGVIELNYRTDVGGFAAAKSARRILACASCNDAK